MAETLTEPGWKEVLAPTFEKGSYKKIENFVAKERAAGPVYPPHNEVYNAFNFTPFEKVDFLW
jgi:uracil-DNA glycosylase